MKLGKTFLSHHFFFFFLTSLLKGSNNPGGVDSYYPSALLDGLDEDGRNHLSKCILKYH